MCCTNTKPLKSESFLLLTYANLLQRSGARGFTNQITNLIKRTMLIIPAVWCASFTIKAHARVLTRCCVTRKIICATRTNTLDFSLCSLWKKGKGGCKYRKYAKMLNSIRETTKMQLEIVYSPNHSIKTS